MLVIRRKARQSVTLIDDRGQKVTITIKQVSANRCTLGIEADRNTNVARTELLDVKAD